MLFRSRGLPISSFMDRSRPDMMRCQTAFIKFFVGPLYGAFSRLVPEAQASCLEKVDLNLREWESAISEMQKHHGRMSSLPHLTSSPGSLMALAPDPAGPAPSVMTTEEARPAARQQSRDTPVIVPALEGVSGSSSHPKESL